MYLIYCRVSTAEQADDRAASLPEQERRGRLIAESRGASLYDVSTYVDVGVSGTVPLRMRPEGSKLIADARKGDTIIAVKLDRIFRSMSDAAYMLEKLGEDKIDLILADIDINPIATSPAAKLFFHVVAAVGEFERARIAERISEGKRSKRARQGHTGGLPKYGYRVEGRGRDAKLVRDETEYETMVMIKTLMEQSTPAYVERVLRERGVRDRAGSHFRITQLQRIAAREDGGLGDSR